MQFTHEACTIAPAPVRSVRADWEDADALPRFLSHIRAVARDASDDLARLVIMLDGRHLEFPAQRTMCDDDTLCWQSLGRAFLYVLSVRLEPLAAGTRVTVTIAYDPPGFITDLMETMGLGKLFQHTLESDLRRYADETYQTEMQAIVAAG